MAFKANKSVEKGQVLLLVLLLVSVVLTIAMYLLSRSIVNIRLSVEEDQSLKALAAAEAGIEKALIANTSIQSGTLSNDSTFLTSKSSLSGTSFLLNNGKVVFKDIGSDLWLSDYSDNPSQIFNNPWTGTLSIYWGSPSDTCSQSESQNTEAALEIVVFSGNRTNANTTRYAYDPCGGARRTGNGFSNPLPGGVISGKTFDHRADIPITSPGLFARVIPIYANTYMAVQGSTSLPSQGTLISSTGKSSEVVRTVSVLRENPSLPVEFLYAFFWPK